MRYTAPDARLFHCFSSGRGGGRLPLFDTAFWHSPATISAARDKQHFRSFIGRDTKANRTSLLHDRARTIDSAFMGSVICRREKIHHLKASRD
ncbi:hypothetical protein N185_16420 [Sinorhizobium sp. GW3]|nr:hypothetical protein N185_16420 [Sinorhizobium sp. GW3]